MGDVLLRNAHIWTGDPAAPWAEAALIRDGRFAFVGRETDFDAPSDAEVIDAGGRLVVPGFIDGHAHLLGTGNAMRAVDLKGIETVAEAARRVGERARATPAGGWVRGAGWDQHLWPGARFPTRHDLNAVAPEHPVVLQHTSGHCVWVNSAALRAAGITAQTQPPVGGAIKLDEHGEPTGVLLDTAQNLISAATPPPSAEDRRAAIELAIRHAHSLGITSVHAMDVGAGELGTLRALHNEDGLSLRVRAFLTARRLDEWVGNVRTSDGDDVLRIGGVKFFADGALGSLTAWMWQPYEGSENTGFPLQPPEELEAQVLRCLESGLAPAVHAIGDRANSAVLDILERARGIAPELPRRVEHAQLLTADDIPRFGALGITASVQPIHATQDMAKVDRFWGERGRFAYAFASLLATGARLAFGSDTPVETMDPIAGLHAAVTRRNERGEPADGWYPGERIGLEAALAAYTSGCAQATREEGQLGRIAAGCYADFVVLSEDLFALDDPLRLLDARVELTVVGGEAIYRRGA